MVRGLVPSMSYVCVEPSWCDCRIVSYMIRSKGWMPFLEWRHLVSYQEISVWDWGPFWHDCRIGSYMIRCECRSLLTYMLDWFLACADVRAEPFRTCMLDWFLACVECKCRAFLTWMLDWFLSWSDVSVGPFWQGCGIGSHMVRCECWACLFDMIIGLVPTWSDISAG